MPEGRAHPQIGQNPNILVSGESKKLRNSAKKYFLKILSKCHWQAYESKYFISDVVLSCDGAGNSPTSVILLFAPNRRNCQIIDLSGFSSMGKDPLRLGKFWVWRVQKVAKIFEKNIFEKISKFSLGSLAVQIIRFRHRWRYWWWCKPANITYIAVFRVT